MTLELLEYKRDHTELTVVTAVSWLLCHYQLQSNNTSSFLPFLPSMILGITLNIIKQAKKCMDMWQN